MNKLILFAFVVFLTIIPQVSATQSERADIVNRSFGCSVEISGEVQFTNQPLNFKVGEKIFIMYCPLKFVYSSDVSVKIDNEVLDFVSGGSIYIVGFFGMYTVNESDDDKTFVHLDGKAMYVIINAMQNVEMDDTYLPIVKSLDNITYPLDKSPLELDDEDLESLAYLSDCKIVGLGEATHGTKEFFQLKHRIFKYLVENHDFKIFAFECDMGESYYVDKYVTKGEGDIDEIMIEKMHFWTWCTEEVKDLLLWMKEYNENKSDDDKIHFIGVDCQFLTHHADILIDYFNKTNVSLSEDSLSFLDEINQISPSLIYDYYSDMSLDKKEEIDQNVDSLLAKIEESKDDLISASSEYEYQFIKRIVLNIKQVNSFYYLYTHENIVNRDFYMAQNTLWASNLFGEKTKVALWAHNGHIMNAEYYDTGTMGFHLKEELKEEYQIIGFAFSFGSFTAVRMKFFGGSYLGTNQIIRQPLFGSINYVFHYAQDDNFILREIDIIDNSSFDLYISEPRQFLDIGAGFTGNSYIYYHDIDFKEHCDILIYWDATLASELLTTQTRHCCSGIFAPNFGTAF